MLKDHKGFVQGVTWDPSNQFVATMSSDRWATWAENVSVAFALVFSYIASVLKTVIAVILVLV